MGDIKLPLSPSALVEALNPALEEIGREIEEVLQQYGQVVPQSVLKAYLQLKDHYARQIESGML